MCWAPSAPEPSEQPATGPEAAALQSEGLAMKRLGLSMVCTTALLGCSGASRTSGPDPAGVGAESNGIAQEHFRHRPPRFHRGDADACDARGGADATSSDASPEDGGRPDVVVDATGEGGGVGTDASEAGIEDAGGQDASVANNGEASVEDAGNPDAQLELDGAACSNSRNGLGGIGVPAGTTATASASWNSTPANAIDGTLVPGWNAGNYTGWIALTFPAPVTLNGIALGAVSLPTTTETYTITGFQGGTSVPLGSWSDTVDTGFVVDLPPMLFAAGTYDGIRIDIQGNASWVSLSEISLLTVDCPAGPGGLYTVGTGAPIDAGPQAVDA